MLLHRQFSDRDLKETIQEKLIINLGGFVTEVGQLEFLLNTEKNIHNLKGKKKNIHKNLFYQLFPSKFYISLGKAERSIFPKLMAFSQHSPTVLSSFG